MKKITDSMIKSIESKFQNVKITDHGNIDVTTEYGTYLITVDAEKNQFSVYDGITDHLCDKFPQVIGYINSQNHADVTLDETPVQQETPAPETAPESETPEAPEKSESPETAPEAPETETAPETPVQFYKLNTKDFCLDTMKLNTRLSNVLDHKYFTRGLAYTMYEKYIAKLENTVSSLIDKKSETPEDSEEYGYYENQIHLYSNLKRKVISTKDAMDFTPEEISDWDSDRFLALVSFAVFGGKIELRNKYNVMGILENIKNIRYSGKQCDLKNLKEALNDIALDFATTADETGHYKNSRINVNSTMTEQVWQVYYRGAKQTKSGNFSNEKFAKRAAIEKEISAQIVGKLQGSIDIED